MVNAVILLCAMTLSTQTCTKDTADDVIHAKVPATACMMAAQTIVAGEAGFRAQGRLMKVICSR